LFATGAFADIARVDFMFDEKFSQSLILEISDETSYKDISDLFFQLNGIRYVYDSEKHAYIKIHRFANRTVELESDVTRNYGWCLNVNGKLTDVTADQIKVPAGSHTTVEWYR